MREHTKMWPIKELEDKDAEIERLKGENNSLRLDAVEYRRLITELCDALESRIDWHVKPLRGDLIQRAREATR
jgi:hypothetical protein